jgi:predicted transcriptional regulator
MSIPVMFPPEWIARLNDLAARRGLSRSALIREALEHSFFRSLQSQDLGTMPADQPKGEVIATP